MKIANVRVLVGIVLGLVITAAAAASDKLPEVSSDGLHLQKNTKAKVVYVKPDASLQQYTQVMLLDCYVQFKDKWEREYNLNEVGLEGRVSDKDVERIKSDLAAEFHKQFTKVLEKRGYKVVSDAGPDVLILRPAIVNLDVNAPDLRSAGMNRSWVRSAGEMTLYLELYDSANSELLARIIDPQADNGMGGAANKVTNTAAVDRILSRWANLLSDHLGEVLPSGT